MGKYYVVTGETGGVITAYYKNLILFAELMGGWKVIREFSDFESAESFILGHLAEIVPRGCLLPKHLELNRLVTADRLLLEQMMCPDDTWAGHGRIPAPAGSYPE